MFPSFVKRWFFNKRKQPSPVVGTGLGIVPSPEDPRDFKYLGVSSSLPDSFFQGGWTIKNQGQDNDCTAFATCNCMEDLEQDVQLSERHLYYHSRKDYMGTFPQNTGVYLRSCLKSAQQVGVCPESLCPTSHELINVVPSTLAESFAPFFRIGEYSVLSAVNDIKTALVNGHKVVIGWMVDKNFQYLTSLDVPEPIPSQFVGGHAMRIYGYDTIGFYVVNQWGVLWGQNGHARIPFAFAANNLYLFEAWAITNLKRRDEP